MAVTTTKDNEKVLKLEQEVELLRTQLSKTNEALQNAIRRLGTQNNTNVENIAALNERINEFTVTVRNSLQEIKNDTSKKQGSFNKY